MRDCRDCLDFTGVFSFGCINCDKYHATKKKSEDFVSKVSFKPNEEALEYFKNLWGVGKQ